MMAERLHNARFWAWINGDWVKLRLEPGQSLTWSSYKRTDEGWSSEGESWLLNGQTVINTCCTEGVDCDGRHSWVGDYQCDIDHLGASIHEQESYHQGKRINTPVWVPVDSYARDYTAEAAGY